MEIGLREGGVLRDRESDGQEAEIMKCEEEACNWKSIGSVTMKLKRNFAQLNRELFNISGENNISRYLIFVPQWEIHLIHGSIWDNVALNFDSKLATLFNQISIIVDRILGRINITDDALGQLNTIYRF